MKNENKTNKKGQGRKLTYDCPTQRVEFRAIPIALLPEVRRVVNVLLNEYKNEKDGK